MFTKYDFGIFYFSRGVSLMKSEVMKNEIKNIKEELEKDIEKKLNQKFNDIMKKIGDIFKNSNEDIQIINQIYNLLNKEASKNEHNNPKK